MTTTVNLNREHVIEACDRTLTEITRIRNEKIEKALSQQFKVFCWWPLGFKNVYPSDMNEYRLLSHREFYCPELDYKNQYKFAERLRALCIASESELVSVSVDDFNMIEIGW